MSDLWDDAVNTHDVIEPELQSAAGLQVQAAFIPTATACGRAVKGLTGDERVDAWDAEFDRIRERVDAYMPRNYVTIEHTRSLFVIGRDNAGWTLDGYVLPRLASGGVFGQVECDQSTLAALTAKVRPSGPPDGNYSSPYWGWLWPA